MHGLIDWLTRLPPAVLYAALAIIGAAENVFPPLPADTVVALGSWLAARGEGNAIAAFLAPVLGNIAGATGMYYVGRAHGAEWMRRRFPSLAKAENEQRIAALYGKYGVAALVLSRFVPGVRALVPPFAGAMEIPAGRAIAAMAIASIVWYGTISYVAFRAGADWNALAHTIAHYGLVIAIVATALLLIAGGYWFYRRKRSPSGS